MPAVSVADPAVANPLLAAIDSAAHWAGDIVVNRLDPGDSEELNLFATTLPSPYVTAGLGVFESMWAALTRGFAVMQTYANFKVAFSDAIDANYLVSDFSKPSNPDVAAISGEPGKGAIIAFNRLTWDGYSSQIQQWIVAHELGHALGLQHLSGLPDSLNYAPYTVMSYNWYQLADEYSATGLPLTPMALDVALLQAKYGAADNNIGNTTYNLANFGSDLDGSDGFVQNGRGYICVWDSGGTDTIAFTGGSGALINLNAATLQTSTLTGDLADVIGDVAQTSQIYARLDAKTQTEIIDPVHSAGGFFSSILSGSARVVGGFTIAQGATIENGLGGFGDDLIIGNSAGNALQGNDGRDDLYGASGTDTLDGGGGDDHLYGGLGNDSITDAAGSNYLRGDEGNDLIIGGSAFDDSNGNMGDDTVHGLGGDDYAVGGKDNDMLFGDTGNDIVWGNLGADTQDGGDGNDQVRGGQGEDTITGGAGDDFVSGDRGNDTIAGGSGADIFHGSQDAGVDRVIDFNRSEGDRVQLDPGTTYTLSQMGADVVLGMGGVNHMILVGVQLSALTNGWIFTG